MNVYYVVLNEMTTGVVPSQVLAPAQAWARTLGITPRVVFLEPARVALSRVGRQRLAELREIWAAGKIHLLPYVGRLGNGSPALSLAALLRVQRPEGRPVLHCRGPEATLQALRAVGRKARVVFDARGAGGPEARLRLAAAGEDDRDLATHAALTAAELERRATIAADAISAVTPALASQLTAQLDPDDPRPVAVVPCCVTGPAFDAAARAAVRGRLAVGPGELLLAHVSTEARWEDFPQIHAFFREIAARRPARLLLLTTLPEEQVTAGLAADDPLRGALLVRRVAPAEIPAHLSAADAGLLLRRPHPAFRVASPIKLAEYLAAGLPVVVSESVTAAAQLIADRGVGVTVAAPEAPEAPENTDVLERAAGRLLSLLATPEEMRERALAACWEVYTWDRYAGEVARLYGLAPADHDTRNAAASLQEAR